MNVSRWLGGAVLLAGCVTLMACSGEGGSPTSPLVFPIMIVTNSWFDEAEPAHGFNLTSDDDRQMRGSYTGTEELADGSSFAVSGNWSDGVIVLRTERLPDTAFRATFATDSPNRLEFSSTSGPLVLIRNQ